MNVYGGNSNTFCTLFTFFCECYGLILIWYVMYLWINEKSIKNNDFIKTGVLGIFVFTILLGFLHQPTFSDEVDNIIGGMLIGKGKILYVDYYTQHTPILYWICAVFSLCQAGSVEQFRLLYFVLISLIYICLYIRHKNNFGKLKMMILPFIEIAFLVTIDRATLMILSDNIQSLAITALVLEFLQYLKDEKLDFKRVLIVSISIFVSIGVAFVSVYAIFAIFVGMVIKEISIWRKNKNISIKGIFDRYWKLFIVCIFPFVIMFIYLILTNSFEAMYEQSFKFNTEVYSNYSEIGANKLEPVYIGIYKLLGIIPNAVKSIIGAKNIVISISKLIVGILIILFIYDKLINKKEYLKVSIIVMFMICSFSRNGFHEAPFWGATLAILLTELNFDYLKNQNSFVCVMICILFFTNSYVTSAKKYILKEHEPVSELEQTIIENTSENDNIFLDIYSTQSVYLIYKNRNPINRLQFILPWYMDWYEEDTISDLENNSPKFVIYNENIDFSSIKGDVGYFKEYLNKNYIKSESQDLLWSLK